MSLDDLYERMKREAEESSLRRQRASRASNLPPDLPHQSERLSLRASGANHAAIEERVEQRRGQRDDIEKLIQLRDPCVRCRVRRDLHADLGCKRWRGS